LHFGRHHRFERDGVQARIALNIYRHIEILRRAG
jgi:hypothetical protein